MKKTVRSLLCAAAALAFVLLGKSLFAGNTADTTVYAAKTDYSSCYTVSGQKITIKTGYTNKDITEILNAALTDARDKATAKKPVTVKVPKGTYKLTSNLRIYSNTTLDLTGVTLKYTGKESHVMLQSGINGAYKGVDDYNTSEKCAGYKGFENITIKGGTFINSSSNTSGSIRMAHAKNVTLEGVTFKGGGCAHLVEVAAINGFYVKDCVFKDWDGQENLEAGYEDDKFEALQLDIPCATKVFRNFYQDGTVMKNVEITGCTFSDVPRGVGTHTFLMGAYHENIKINNNTFKNIDEEAIVCLGYKNSEVKNNTIKNCGGGILFQYFKANTSSVYSTILDGKKNATGKVQHNANSVISGNKITIKYTKQSDEIQAIKVYGYNLESAGKGADGKKIKAQNYYISGVTVSKNTIVTAGYGIHMMDAVNCTITDNTITAKGIKSSDPYLKITDYDGIYLANGSSAKKISNNKITGVTGDGCGYGYGIKLYKSGKVTGNMSGNTIDTVQKSGILISLESSVQGKISGNKVTNAVEDGIRIERGSTVKGAIDGNEFSSVGKRGIIIYDADGASTVTAITNNTVTNAGSYGINLTSAKNDVTISGNHVSGCGSYSLMLQPSSDSYTLTIKDNTISGSGDATIAIYIGKGKVYVSGNTLSNAGCGIRVAKDVTGTIDLNNYGDGISQQVNIAGKKMTQTSAIQL